MDENRIAKRVLYMNMETTRPRCRPRNRWLDEVREDGSAVGGEEWQEKVQIFLNKIKKKLYKCMSKSLKYFTILVKQL
jgi:hypothetical protein